MAYGEYSQSNRNKSTEPGQEIARNPYTDMFAIYGASSGYAHLQQYLGSSENPQGSQHYKSSPFRLTPHQPYSDQTPSHLQMLQSFTSDHNDPLACSQLKRNFESPPQEDGGKNTYKSRCYLQDPASRPRALRQCDTSPLEGSSSFKNSPSSDSTYTDGTSKLDSNYQCLSVGSCVC